MPLIVLLYALFGSVFTAAKIGLDHSEPFFLVGFRMFFAGVLLLAYQGLRQRDQLRLPRSLCWKVVLLGVFNIYLTNAFEFWGMQYLSSSKTSFIYSLSPFFAALLSYVVFKERMSAKKWLGLTIGFIGFIPILIKQTGPELSLGAFGFISMAEASVMAAACMTVYGWILMRQLVVDNISPLTANGYSMIVGGSLSLVHSLLVESWTPVPVHGSWPLFTEAVIWMTIVSSLICYNLYGYLLRSYTVTFVSFAGFMTPFFAALFSWFMIGESLTWSFYLSAVIVFAGLYLFYQEELKAEGIRRAANAASEGAQAGA